MAENRAEKWRIAHLRGGAASIAIAVMLLSQSGCRQGASDLPSSAAQAGSGKAVAASPEQSPGVNPGPEQAVETSVTPGTNEGDRQSASAPQEQKTRAPGIEFTTMVQDLGEIGPETAHTTQFTFKNTGNATLKITSIKPCCGSTTRGVNAGDTFAPGKGGTLEVEYHSGSYLGALHRNVSMNTNDPDHSQVNLSIKANVVLRVECLPQHLSLFMHRENAGCGPITLKSLDGRPFSITGFLSTANTITAEFDPKVKATQFTLQPKADMEKLDRNPRGQISISLTHPECSNARVPYDVLPEFTSTPAQLILVNLKENEPVQREILIVSNHRKDFEIESVESQRGAIKLLDSRKLPPLPVTGGVVESDEPPAARHQLHVEITPPPVEDKRFIFSDILHVKIKDSETLAIQCRGFYAPK